MTEKTTLKVGDQVKFGPTMVERQPFLASFQGVIEKINGKTATVNWKGRGQGFARVDRLEKLA
jgi:hypothetical protein